MKNGIDVKTVNALRIQFDHATQGGGTSNSYCGLRTAILSIIQAHFLTIKQAKKVLENIGLTVSNSELEKWIK